jgi:hypothetical protein
MVSNTAFTHIGRAEHAGLGSDGEHRVGLTFGSSGRL